ncbi:MAG TPA: NAD(P)-dependent oxidoreductase [Polyangiaceae bacterium]|nr:NAD(P)-dependent oxidoreductase [Polyangiaceae bacterium]
MRDTISIAFLGLGAMGTRMASRLVSDDIDLRVWSRSGVPQGSPELGSIFAPTVAAAVKDVDLVIVMVTDDDASRAVWLDAGALRGMRSGAVAVECSTLSPQWVSELARRAREAGVDFVDAPVVGSRPQAHAGGLIFLAGGDPSIVDGLRPTLLRMGPAVHHVGASPAGTRAKLVANALFAVQVAALGELVGVARRMGMDVAGLVQVLGELSVMSPAAKGAATGMLEGGFAPMFPLSLGAKDLRYAMAQADAVGSSVPMTCAASEVFQRGRSQGFSDENLTAIAKLYVAE